jgi:hypothetical protein
MTSKLIAIAALSLALSSPLAFAQMSGGKAGTSDPGTTSSTGSSGGEDAAAYLAGPNIREFFTDNNGSTLRPQSEMKQVYRKMSSNDQTKLRSACSTNKDRRYNKLCSSVGKM